MKADEHQAVEKVWRVAGTCRVLDEGESVQAVAALSSGCDKSNQFELVYSQTRRCVKCIRYLQTLVKS
jgi:hypothetical protein